MAKNEGKIFEEDIQKSAKKQGLFFYRIKDVNQASLKRNARVAKNFYDSFLYNKPHLYPIELKSTKAKSISFSEYKIKQHQIAALSEASRYEGVVSGFILNFRTPENRAFFIHIDEFNTYKFIAESGDSEIHKSTYKSKVNEKSIPIGICEEIGIEITCEKKRTRYTYRLDELVKKLALYNKEGSRLNVTKN